MFLKKVKKSPVVREKMKSVAKKKAISVSLATILPNANKHYVVGNLVWVKVGSHPFWPSMVTYDPLTGDFHRDQPGKNGKKKTLYHVQYFGKAAMRGWSVSQRMFPFEGKEKFKAVEQSALHKVKKKTGMYKKIEKMFRVSAAAKPLWNEAIDEALKAFAIKDLNDRLEANVFNYYVPSGALKRAKELNVDLNTNERQVKRCLRNENSDEPYCKICKRDEPDFACTGSCNKAFHKDCLGLLRVPQGFKCPDCDLDEHSCFVCKSPDGDFIKCSLSKCGRSYHEYCLSRYGCGNKEKNICPRHTCLTCYNENPKNVMARKGTMLQCTECPTAYHSYHTCIAAGSKMMGPNKLVCPDHFFRKHKSLNEQRKTPRKHESLKKKRKTAVKPKSSNEQRKSQTINVLYCCICCLGGELVCCETCPNAYHKSCINVEVSEGDFFCEDCTKRKHLTYGAIIWGKTGKYRWWPGKIMHPDNIPQNVQKIKHLDGDFPVLYFGTGEYDWLHRGRVIPYAEHHKEMISEGSSAVNTLKIKFKKSLKEASEAYDEYQHLRASENNMSEEPEEYKPLKVNKAVPPAQIVPLDVTSSSSPCLCDPSMDNPCGPESSCLNLSLLMECHSGICNADDRCKNRRFQKRQYACVKRIKTRNRGWGLITCQEIKKADFVIEYVGEVITYKEYRKRAEMLQAQGKSNFYFLQLDSTRIIDAGPSGNAARFINHSCDPNCEMVKWSVNGDVRIGIFALYDIAAGEELTFNYECDTSCQQKCFCGSANCSGVIGRNLSSVSKVTKPPSENKKHVANKMPIRSKSKQKTEAYEREDNHCFICKSPGSLILCDKEGCIRAYHIRCLGLSRVPEGDWMCPWHFCSSCASEAYRFCLNCPVSYCRKHLPSGLMIRGKSFRCSNCQGPRQTCPSSVPSESANSLAALVNESSSAPSLNQYPGEKLTYNYECNTLAPKKGFPTSANCSISGKNSVSKMTKPPSENKKHAANKVPIRSKSKRKIETYEQEENHCFICKNPGSLILCDKEGCIRAYHIRCLGLSKVPEGDWLCPWHICSSCPLEAYRLCSNCPVSYCREHLPSGLTKRVKSFRCSNCQSPPPEPPEWVKSVTTLMHQSSSAPSLNQSAGEKLTYNCERNTLSPKNGSPSSANCSISGKNSVLEVTKQPSETMGQVANKVCIGNKSDEDNETDHSYLYERELCFVCKTPGGYLICCQLITCLKNYHLDCVGLTRHPEGNWICPLHICNYCYSEAYRFCSDCPVSYCRAHLPLGLKIQGKEFRCTNCRRPPQPCPSSEPSESLKSATTLMSQSSSAPSLNQYPGEKLTVNYECDTLSPKEGSYCSANCSGLTGGNSVSKVTKQPSENKMDLVNEVPNGSNSEQKLEIYEPDANHCFICKKPGSLISCINVSCIRAYHLHCVGLTEAPKGSWECSRHFCSTCKREAYSYCSNCPVSYCQEHLPSGLQGKSFRCINCQNPQQLCPPSESLNSLAALVSQSSSAPFLKDHADGSLYEKGQ